MRSLLQTTCWQRFKSKQQYLFHSSTCFPFINALPAKGAFYTGKYTNHFKHVLGISQEQVDARMDSLCPPRTGIPMSPAAGARNTG